MPSRLEISLDDDALAALDRFIAVAGEAKTREQAASEILSRWVAEQKPAAPETKDEGLKPGELNSSNDI